MNINDISEPAPDGRGGYIIHGDKAASFAQRTIGNQAPGAILNGKRIRKINAKPGDRHPDGTEGVVVGSTGPFQVYVDHEAVTYGYFVQWDNDKVGPVFSVDVRIEEAE